MAKKLKKRAKELQKKKKEHKHRLKKNCLPSNYLSLIFVDFFFLVNDLL